MMEDKKPLSVIEDKKAAVTVASEAAAAEEPNELNVRLLEEGKDDAAARLAARNLAQNVRDESSDFSRMRQAWAALFTTIGCFMNGGAIAYTGPALPNLMNNGTKDLYGNDLSVSFQSASWIVGLLSLGAFFGFLISGPMMDKIGRRRTLLTFTTFNFLAGYGLLIASFHHYMIWCGRFLCGVAVGSDLAVSTAYITEISKKDVRGALGFLVQLMGSLGVLYTFALGYFLDWKWLAVANAAWVAPFCLSVLASPESPRWLLSKGRQYSASKSLAWLRGRGRPAEIEREIEAIKAEIAFEARNQRSSITALGKPGAWQPLLIALALVFFLNFSGIHVLLAYSTTIFALGGAADAVDPRTSTIALGAAVFFSCVASIGVLSRLRRRLRLLVVGSVLGMGLAQIVLALCFLYAERREEGIQLALQAEEGEEERGNATVAERRRELELAEPLPEHVRWLPVCAVLFFIVIGNIGYGTLLWVVTERLLPARISKVGKSVVVGFSFACAFVVSKTFVDLVEHLGNSGAFFVYGGICFVGFVFCLLFAPNLEPDPISSSENGENNEIGCCGLVRTNLSPSKGFQSSRMKN